MKARRTTYERGFLDRFSFHMRMWSPPYDTHDVLTLDAASSHGKISTRGVGVRPALCFRLSEGYTLSRRPASSRRAIARKQISPQLSRSKLRKRQRPRRAQVHRGATQNAAESAHELRLRGARTCRRRSCFSRRRTLILGFGLKRQSSSASCRGRPNEGDRIGSNQSPRNDRNRTSSILLSEVNGSIEQERFCGCWLVLTKLAVAAS
jgi:hypothetical protein